MSDHPNALFERYRSHNDLRALARLFDAVAPELACVAAHLAKSTDEAEDLVQATFLSAIERSAHFDPKRPLVPWLLGILALHARKQRARAGRELDGERVHQPADSDPERDAEQREVTAAVGQAVERLSPACAPLVRRYLLEGATTRQLAREFEIHPITARVRLHRGLKQLRKLLPIGLSVAAFGVVGSRVNLSVVRTSVLRSAAQLTGASVPVTSLASGALVLALLAPLALAVPAWLVWRTPSGVIAELATLEPAAASHVASLARVEASALATADAEALEPQPVSARTSAQPIPVQARLRGRLLRPDGSPAVGALVDLDGSVRNSQLAEFFGPPAQWVDPAPLVCDEGGEFEWNFEAPPAYQFFLTATAEGCARANWRWTKLEANQQLDLGDVELEAAGEVSVRVLNAQGEALGLGWRVSADVPAPNSFQGRVGDGVQAHVDAAGSTFSLKGLPARRVTLRASTENFARAEDLEVTALAGVNTVVELRYFGADPLRRIGIGVRMPPGVHSAPATEHVWLTQPGQPARQAQAQSSHISGFSFDDLELGASYGVLIDDPRFEPWSQVGVQPGETLRPQLRGNAALSVRILQPNQVLYTGSYRLSVEKFAGQFHSGLILVSASDVPPADGRVSGLVPGDYEFEFSIAGHGRHRVVVAQLAAQETREVELLLGLPVGIQGRVLSSDGTSPMAGVDVQLTRGDVAGHTLAPGATISAGNRMIHFRDARTSTDAQARFQFADLQPGPWTVRAAWSPWLFVDQTVVLPLEGELEFVQPPCGSFAGQLLWPSGSPIGDAVLWIIPMVDGAPRTPRPHLSGLDDPSGLASDGSFQYGPLPVGEVSVTLMVTTDGIDESSSGSGPWLGTFTIAEGAPQMQLIDVRSTFPARVHGSVFVDGVAATAGLVTIRSVPPSSPQQTRGRLSAAGQFRYGGLEAGSEQRLEYTSPTGWSWAVPQTIVVAAGSDTECAIAITTIEREIRIVDANTLQPLPHQRIAWRTGLDFAATQDPPGELERGGGRSDAQGKLNVRLPQGPVRFVALPSGTFIPPTMDWSAGSAPIVLRMVVE